MTDPPINPTHYDTLRVDGRASEKRVRLAYRRLAQKFHPDKYQGRGDSAALMAEINRAYEVLSDPSRRAEYDRTLAVDARPLRPDRAVFVQDRFGWAFWLLLAVISLAVLTVGYVVLNATVPAQAPLRVSAPLARPAPAADPMPLAPAPRVEPWSEPQRAAVPPNDATDPVRRLVRDGVVEKPPTRR